MRFVSPLLGLITAFALATASQAADPTPAEAPPAAAPAEAAAAPPAEAAPAPAPAPRARHAVTLGPTGTDAEGRPGRIHTVVRGDTLWDISEAYLGTPWVWPSIWDDNPEVPNPHRIFPGNRIWISPDSMRQLTDAEADAMLARQPEMPASVGDAVAAPLGTIDVSWMGSIGFVSADLFEGAASIVGSARQEGLLAQDLPVYISVGEGEVQVGDRFTMVRARDEVRDPETERELGVFVHNLGWLEVTEIHPETSTAMIRMATDGIERGDRLVPRREVDREVEIRTAMAPVEGQVAFFADDRSLMGNQDTVYLNRGADHGLQVGSALEVFQAQGDAEDAVSGQQRALPDDVFGSLVVVSVEPDSAAAVVTQATRSIERGDHFRNASPR